MWVGHAGIARRDMYGTPTAMRLILCLCVAFFPLIACGERGPKAPQVSTNAALGDKKPRQMKVTKVWNLVDDHVRPKDGNNSISHMIEVDILTGDKAGTTATLPYDEWMAGAAPPSVGDTVTASPNDWVARNPKSKGRPYGGW